MSTSVKEMVEAADAVVPRITPQEAQRLIAAGDALIVDVRDGAEVAREGMVAGAINISRGMLEFRADPSGASFEPRFDKGHPVIVYCASGGRSALIASSSIASPCAAITSASLGSHGEGTGRPSRASDGRSPSTTAR